MMRAEHWGTGMLVGAVLVGVVAYSAIGGEYDRLCPGGHIAKRSAHVTYAGLHPRWGHERDHVVPLCLGGADDASNVVYEPLGEAKAKEKMERRMCEDYCAGKVQLDDARTFFSSGKWREYIDNCCRD